MEELCLRNNRSAEHCACYVKMTSDALSEQHHDLLNELASLQVRDALSEDEARAQMYADHGQVTMTRFYNALVGPDVDAELSCPE